MKKIHCLVVDDEPPAIDLLVKYASMIDRLEVIGKTHSAIHAFDLLKEKQIDLMFLDIRMPILNGLDFIKTLKKPPAIIITTAYREYALDGYDLDIIDYLLKPITFERFLKAVDRYENKTSQMAIQNSLNKSPDHIFCNINRTFHKIILRDILFIESLKDYVRIHTKKEQLVVKGNLGSFMKKLPEKGFVRIHRSYAIAVRHIKSYNQNEVDIQGRKLPVGVKYRRDLKFL